MGPAAAGMPARPSTAVMRVVEFEHGGMVIDGAPFGNRLRPMSWISPATWLGWLYRPRPEVKLEVFCNGGHEGVVGITVKMWNEGRGSTFRAVLRLLLDNEVIAERIVDLAANAADQRERFDLLRPDQADLVRECADEPTFYGRALNVEFVRGSRVLATAHLIETERVQQWRALQRIDSSSASDAV